MQEPAPINYTIRLEPDLDNFKFSGTAAIRIGSQAAVEKILLNIF
jgi:hypothetical protein